MTTTLHRFADVLITAVKHASKTINEFNQKLDIEIKSDGSQVTQVDALSQKLIFSIILNYYPTINIIGEESVGAGVPKEELPELIKHEYKVEDKELNIDDLVIYVDPLDGTYSFIEKQYDCVCVLVGATYKGKPIVGVVSKPFSNCEITYAVENFTSEIHYHKQSENIIFTSSTTNDISNIIKDFPEKYELHYKSGSGAKMMMIIENEADIYYHPLIQSCTWDTLAAQVILEALGGLVCDIYGNPLKYPTTKGDVSTMRHLKGVLCMSPRSKKYLNWMVNLKKEI